MARRKLLKHMLNIITNGYTLLFITKPILARLPLILLGYKDQQKDLALASRITAEDYGLSRGL